MVSSPKCKSDGNTPSQEVKNPYEHVDIQRKNSVETVKKEFPRGVRHGSRAKFILNDYPCNSDDLCIYKVVQKEWDLGDNKCVTHNGTKYTILSKSFKYLNKNENDTFGVTLCKSNWKAGYRNRSGYTPSQKYTVTVRQLGNNQSILFDRTPARSLSVTLIPQYGGLIYKDGSKLRLPHGEGCLVKIQTTWIESPDEFVNQVKHLFDSVFQYELSEEEINNDSKGFSGAEVYHRVHETVEDRLIHTMHQTSPLLAQEDASFDANSEYDMVWKRKIIKSTMWENLGFPRLNASVQLKYYHPVSEKKGLTISKPKIEAALVSSERITNKNGRDQRSMIPWSRWDEIMILLDEILLSHLYWADVSISDLAEDHYSKGMNNEVIVWKHPEGRIDQLREYFDDLETKVCKAVFSSKSILLRDILTALCRRGRMSYQDLVNKTGAAKRTIRGYVKRLEELATGDDPGVLNRWRSAITFVNFSSPTIKKATAKMVQKIRADEGDTERDYKNRASQRVKKHLINNGFSEADAELLIEGVQNSTEYMLSDLREIRQPSDANEIISDLRIK